MDDARALVEAVLRGVTRISEEPHLLDDDRLPLAIGTLSLGDPGWLLARLIDRTNDYDTRLLVWTQLSGPPRSAAAACLRAERTKHGTWNAWARAGLVAREMERSLENGALSKRLQGLKSSSANERELAADELRDIGIYAGLDPESYRQSAEALLIAALRETDWKPLEAILNAVAELAAVADSDRVESVDWSPLAALLEWSGEERLLVYALDALEATADPAHRAAIGRVASHPSSEVRRAAARALAASKASMEDGAKTD